MKKFNIVLALLALTLASLACQTLTNGGSDPQPLPPADSGEEFPAAPSEESSEEFDFSFGADTEFPLPDDATSVTEVVGTVNYQTSLTVEEVMDFYRNAFEAQGYAEREILTNVADGTFSMVFDGHESGQSIVVQGFDLGDGTTNVNVRLEAIN